MKYLIALLAAVALTAPLAASSLPPPDCYPQPYAPYTVAYNYAYFLGETIFCGSQSDINLYHYSAKIIDAQSGQILGTWNGEARGDHDFDFQFPPVWCMKADGSGRYVFGHLWIGISGYSKSRASSSVQCRRQSGGTAPDG